MASAYVSSGTSREMPGAGFIDMSLEVVTLPVGNPRLLQEIRNRLPGREWA